MAAVLSKEENSRRILDIYSLFGSAEGDVIEASNIVAVADRRNWNIKQLTRGLDYAVEQGWIEKLPEGGLRLTAAGFEVL